MNLHIFFWPQTWVCINGNNLFYRNRIQNQASKMEISVKKVKGFQLLIIFVKSFVIDVSVLNTPLFMAV